MTSSEVSWAVYCITHTMPRSQLVCVLYHSHHTKVSAGLCTVALTPCQSLSRAVYCSTHTMNMAQLVFVLYHSHHAKVWAVDSTPMVIY